MVFPRPQYLLPILAISNRPRTPAQALAPPYTPPDPYLQGPPSQGVKNLPLESDLPRLLYSNAATGRTPRENTDLHQRPYREMAPNLEAPIWTPLDPRDFVAAR